MIHQDMLNQASTQLRTLKRTRSNKSFKSRRVSSLGTSGSWLPADAIGVIARHNARASGKDEVNGVAHSEAYVE